MHHGIRGKAADADARFVAALAKKLGAPFFLGKYDVPAEAKKTGESLEGIILLAIHVRLLFSKKTNGNFVFTKAFLNTRGAAQSAVRRIIGASAINAGAENGVVPCRAYFDFSCHGLSLPLR